MKNSLDILVHDLLLKQSVIYEDEYESFEEDNFNISTFNDLSITNLGDWYNNLTLKYSFINELQLNYLNSFINSLEYILDVINPEKLNIKDDESEESDLVLWRESVNGISQLIFDEFGQVFYIFTGNNGRKQKGVFEGEINMKKLLFRFLSK